MSPSCHPYIKENQRKYLDGLSHHLMKENTNIKKGITRKHAKLQYQKDWMLIDIPTYLMKVKKCLDMDILIYEYIGKWECQSFLFKMSFIICEAT